MIDRPSYTRAASRRRTAERGVARVAEREGGRAAAPTADREALARHSWPLRTLRYVLPAMVVIAGLGVMALGDETDLLGGASIVSAGLAIFLANFLVRLGVAGERQRDLEDAAREYFDRHGRWPS
jgi:hypothetical protein